jgi:hypothetical protein
MGHLFLFDLIVTLVWKKGRKGNIKRLINNIKKKLILDENHSSERWQRVF